MKNSTHKNHKLLFIEENCPSSKDIAHKVETMFSSYASKRGMMHGIQKELKKLNGKK